MRYLLTLVFVVLLAASAFAETIIYNGPGEFNLGLLEEGKVYYRSFYFENNEDAVLRVQNIRVSCGCVKILSPKEMPLTLMPQEKLEIKFSFDARGILGEVSKNIYILTDNTKQPMIRIKIKANVKEGPKSLLEKFKALNLGVIFSAGLIDAINPCAFTVLVFFISFLTFFGYSGKQMVLAGASFIFAIFLTYLLLGLGAFKILRSLEFLPAVSMAFYYITAILAFILAVLNIYDYIKYKLSGSTDKLKLQLPKSVKNIIQKFIRKELSQNQSKNFIFLGIGTFVCGVIIALLESVCTGQVYLPTIVFVLKTTQFKVQSFIYLLLYNTMFILPLIIILILAIIGVTWLEFSKLATRHLGKIKIISAFLFFVLGVGILILLRLR